MKKSKRWKIEDRYYGHSKFDRAYVDNYEGNHLPMHRLRDRRNCKDSKVWIPCKYLEGLIIKYINKPIKALEDAYNRRIKDVPNAESFRDAYDYLIRELCTRSWRRRTQFKYIIEDNILKRNPEYQNRRYYSKRYLKGWQYKYNLKHIINPGEIRTRPINSWSKSTANMKNRKPIFLGKLYLEVGEHVLFANVYHYCPDFLTSYRLETDIKLREKKIRFEKEWIKVNIGITSLDCYKYEPNPQVAEFKEILKKEDLTEEQRSHYQEKLKWSNPIVRNNYGIGRFLYPVCKIKELEEILNSSQQ